MFEGGSMTALNKVYRRRKMAKYRKKPVIIEAIRWNGTITPDVTRFFGSKRIVTQGRYLLIRTLEGIMKANPGDYVIRGVKGELYPCKLDIFNQTYEKIEESKQN